MSFDSNPHLFRMIVIRCGNLLLPEEKNVTTLYERMNPLLGVASFKMTTKTSEYNANYQLIRSLVLSAGEKLREARGLSKEEDLDKLFDETSVELGMAKIEPEPPKTFPVGQEVNHLPAPHEMMDDKGKLIIPRKDCPKCGEKESMILGPLCLTCEDAKGEDGSQGYYKSMWQCQKCQFKDRSIKHFVQWLTELGVDFGTGTKESMGVKTFTDEGMK